MQLNHEGPSAYGVVAFAEGENATPGFVWAVHLDEQREIEALLWTAHAELVGAFGSWLAGLERPPVTSVLLGGGVRLNEKTAKAAAQLLRQMFDIAGLHHGPRPVCQIGQNGRVKTFASVAAAGAANGVSRARIIRRIETLAIRSRGLWI